MKPVPADRGCANQNRDVLAKELSCFNPKASRTVLPYYELRSKLAIEGKTPEQIAEVVQAV
jgi:hypothetical protein